MRKRGLSRFSVESFLSHSTEKLRKETLLSLKRNSSFENFRAEEGEGYHNLPSSIFCLTVPKYFVEEPFNFSENFWYRKMFMIGESGGYYNFLSKWFCLIVSKDFVEEPLCAVFQKISGSEKICGQEGALYYHGFASY